MVGTIGMATCNNKKKKKKNQQAEIRFYVHKLKSLIQQSEPILPAIISL